MTAEKIIKRENGSQVLITASFYIGHSDPSGNWSISVQTREKGKKKWLPVYNGDDYDYRKLSLEDRRKFIRDAELKFCTLEEMHDVKMELWNALKPAQ